MYWCTAACVAGVSASVHTSIVVGPYYGARLCCAEPWLGMRSKVALPALCQVLHSTSVFVNHKFRWKNKELCWQHVSGDQAPTLSRQKDLLCSPSPKQQDLCTSCVYFSFGDVCWHSFISFIFHGIMHMWASVCLFTDCCLWLTGGILRPGGWYLTSLSVWVKIQKVRQDFEVNQARERGCHSLNFLLIHILCSHDFAICTFAVESDDPVWEENGVCDRKGPYSMELCRLEWGGSPSVRLWVNRGVGKIRIRMICGSHLLVNRLSSSRG